MNQARTFWQVWTVALAVLIALAMWPALPAAQASAYCSTLHISCGEVTNNSSYTLYVGPLQGNPGYPAAYYSLSPGQKSTQYLADADFIAPKSVPVFITWGATRQWVYVGQFAKIDDHMHFTCVNGSSGTDVWCYAS